MKYYPAASKEEILKAAVHETMHAAMCAHLGVYVYKTSVSRCGSGYCENRVQGSKVTELRFSVAGYVGECLFTNRPISVEDFMTEPTFSDDARDVKALLQDKRLRGDIAMNKALEYCASYFIQPDVYRKCMILAEKLSRMRVMPGRYYNRRFP